MALQWSFWRRSNRRDGRDFAEELRSHLELEALDLEREGMTTDEAQRKARVAFGNVALAQERFQLRHRVMWIDDLVQDLRYAIRGMAKSKGFTVAAVLTLALGMGANTAIFSLIDAVLLRSLPVTNPQELYLVRYLGDAGVGIAPPYPYFKRVEAQTKAFSGVAAFNGPGFVRVRVKGVLEQAYGARVSGDFFAVLGLHAAAGRLLTPEDQKLNPAVAVIGYDYWQRRFGGSPAAVGSTFEMDATQFTIVGVMPRGFKGMKPGAESDYVLPMATMLLGGPDAAAMLTDTNSPWFEMVGRLRPGVTPEQARAEAETIFQAFFKDNPAPPGMAKSMYRTVVLASAAGGLDYMKKEYARPLEVLMALVGLVLLIACANITNLLLARAAKRQREFAVRVALGAGRARLFRQLLAETALLFLLGMAAGGAVAWYAVKTLLLFFAHGVNGMVLDAGWDWRVVVFTVGVSLAATLVFGAAPILRAVKADPQQALKDGGKASGGRAETRLGRVLVVLQVSLSLVLLVGAMLFVRTLRNLHAIDAGFRPERVVLTTVQLMEASYPEEPARVAMWSRVLDAVRGLPGVESAAVSEMTPMDFSARHVAFRVPGPHPEGGLFMNTVSEDYFSTLGASVVRGRAFTAADSLQATHVAVLNAAAVRLYFGERDPLGVTAHLNNAAYQIIGVVRDIKEGGLKFNAAPQIYLPMRQPYDRNFRMTLSVKTGMEAGALVPAIEKAVLGVGGDLLVTHAGTMVEQMDEMLVRERLVSGLTVAFGGLALVLSAVGLYGVLAYSVVRRMQEIGIRLALGELPGQVLRGILGEMGWLVGVGLVVGVPASLLLARVGASLLYGVKPGDLWVQVAAVAVLAVVGLAASFVPAYRASRVNPLEALRYE